MEPIRGKPGPDFHRADSAQPKPPVGPSDPARPFEIGPAEGAAASGEASTAGSARPDFDRLRSRIEQTTKAGCDKGQVLHEVVGGELRLVFGAKANPQMQQAVAEKFASDPHLSGLFNQLLGRAAMADS